jgi:C-terminal processing protease CtpA/Prc
MSGLDVSRREDGRLAINRVVRASAAEEAGPGPQDIVEEVMGRPAGDVGLIEFREMMKTEGNKVTLGVDRLGKKRAVMLTLRRQI